jgi:hypothetical protein
MAEPIGCALCRSTKDRRLNRIGGVDLCGRCYDGGAVDAADDRGFRLEVECTVVGHGDKRFYRARGSATVAKPLFDASFRRKGLASLAGLFGMTIRVPDPLFHELGVIITRDVARTRRFIEEDGAQSAVMDLLGEDVSIKVRRTGQIRLSGQRTSDPFDQTAIERELAVLLVHLDRWTEG